MLKISGYSDDVICVEGNGGLDEEFYPRQDANAKTFLAMSDGTLLQVRYDDNALWRFDVIARGLLFATKEEGSVEEDRGDVVTMGDGVRWVAMADQAVVVRAKREGEVGRENG